MRYHNKSVFTLLLLLLPTLVLMGKETSAHPINQGENSLIL